jgi:hypothetical protein
LSDGLDAEPVERARQRFRIALNGETVKTIRVGLARKEGG